jgi:hypothetical protein
MFIRYALSIPSVYVQYQLYSFLLTVLRSYLTVSGSMLKGRSNVEKLLGNISMFYLVLSILLMLFAELSTRHLQRCGDMVSVCTLGRLLFLLLRVSCCYSICGL